MMFRALDMKRHSLIVIITEWAFITAITIKMLYLLAVCYSRPKLETLLGPRLYASIKKALRLGMSLLPFSHYTQKFHVNAFRVTANTSKVIHLWKGTKIHERRPAKQQIGCPSGSLEGDPHPGIRRGPIAITSSKLYFATVLHSSPYYNIHLYSWLCGWQYPT